MADKIMTKQEFVDKFLKDKKDKERKVKFEYYDYKAKVVNKSCKRRGKW